MLHHEITTYLQAQGFTQAGPDRIGFLAWLEHDGSATVIYSDGWTGTEDAGYAQLRSWHTALTPQYTVEPIQVPNGENALRVTPRSEAADAR